MRASEPPAPALRRPELRLSGFYAGYFLVAGAMLPFWPLFLEARGLGPERIGLLLALSLWLRAAVGPLIGRHADRTGNTRMPLLACAFGALAAMVAFFWAQGFWQLLAASVVFFIAYAGVLPLGEAAIAAGACGLLVEAHPHVVDAQSDGPQALSGPELARLGSSIGVAPRRTRVGVA